MNVELKILERNPVVVKDLDVDSLNLIQQLADEAEEVLGYSKLKATLVATKQVSALTQALNELEITPFTKESVEQYKKQIALGKSPNFLTRHPKFATGFTNISSVLTLFAFGNCFTGWMISPWLGAASILVTIVGAVMISSVTNAAKNGGMGEWKHVPLKGYEKPVPEFAIQRAIDIKKQLPTVELEVDEYINFRVDPFLVVKHGEEEYHIDVWDEPEFEANF